MMASCVSPVLLSSEHFEQTQTIFIRPTGIGEPNEIKRKRKNVFECVLRLAMPGYGVYARQANKQYTQMRILARRTMTSNNVV